MKFSSLFLTAIVAVTLAACDSNDPDDGGNLEVQTASNVAADFTPINSGGNGPPPSGTGRYTLFDLETGEIVLSYEEEDRSDSLSTNWDIGFQQTNVIANTTQGSEGGIQFIDDIFEDILEAPAGGYDSTLPEGVGWWSYNGQTHIISPIPGRTILIRTAEGNYAKIRIHSYYEDAPADPVYTDDQWGYYTFDYIVQTDGSRVFPAE